MKLLLKVAACLTVVSCAQNTTTPTPPSGSDVEVRELHLGDESMIVHGTGKDIQRILASTNSDTDGVEVTIDIEYPLSMKVPVSVETSSVYLLHPFLQGESHDIPRKFHIEGITKGDKFYKRVTWKESTKELHRMHKLMMDTMYSQNFHTRNTYEIAIGGDTIVLVHTTNFLAESFDHHLMNVVNIRD